MQTGFVMVDAPNTAYVQGQARRRQGNVPVGLAVIHTFEIAPDIVPPDLSAETGARYLQSRDSPGCYHRLVDSDSRIPLYPWEWETWHDTLTNKWSNGFCMATVASKWGMLSRAHQDALMLNCARDVAAFIGWEKDVRGVTVPVRWISRAEAEAKRPGITRHRTTDPTRRKDPWTSDDLDRRFLEMVGDLVGSPEVPLNPDVKRPGLLVDGVFGEWTVKALQRALGNVGENVGAADGNFGSRSKKAYQHWLARCGFYGGRIDGDFGCVSVRAEQMWLSSHGTYGARFDCDRGTLTIKGLQTALNKGKIS